MYFSNNIWKTLQYLQILIHILKFLFSLLTVQKCEKNIRGYCANHGCCMLWVSYSGVIASTKC